MPRNKKRLVAEELGEAELEDLVESPEEVGNDDGNNDDGNGIGDGLLAGRPGDMLEFCTRFLDV